MWYQILSNLESCNELISNQQRLILKVEEDTWFWRILDVGNDKATPSSSSKNETLFPYFGVVIINLLLLRIFKLSLLYNSK